MSDELRVKSFENLRKHLREPQETPSRTSGNTFENLRKINNEA